MRNHATIVRDYGAQALFRLLKSSGFDVHPSTPQRWAERSSIPGEYWAVLAENEIASLEEMAAAAATRKSDLPPIVPDVTDTAKAA